MQRIDNVETLHKIELDILSFIHEVCEEHNLKYFLAYGSLIGAVRHHGFIPWDDDIDIMMPRSDYESFCEILRTMDSRYTLLDWRHSKDYRYLFAKVCDSTTHLEERVQRGSREMGVYVDIFPYDNYPGQRRLKTLEILAKFLHWEMMGFESMKSHRLKWKNILRYPLYILIRAVGYKNLNRVAESLCKVNNGIESGLAGCFCFMDNQKEVFNKELVARCIPVDFEDRTFYIPQGYDELLRNEYGDYMQLPPPKDRVSNHSFSAWFKASDNNLL